MGQGAETPSRHRRPSGSALASEDRAAAFQSVGAVCSRRCVASARSVYSGNQSWPASLLADANRFVRRTKDSSLANFMPPGRSWSLTVPALIRYGYLDPGCRPGIE